MSNATRLDTELIFYKRNEKSQSVSDLDTETIKASSLGVRGNSYENALRSVTQSVTNCIPTLEHGKEKILR